MENRVRQPPPIRFTPNQPHKLVLVISTLFGSASWHQTRFQHFFISWLWLSEKNAKEYQDLDKVTLAWICSNGAFLRSHNNLSCSISSHFLSLFHRTHQRAGTKLKSESGYNQGCFDKWSASWILCGRRPQKQDDPSQDAYPK